MDTNESESDSALTKPDEIPLRARLIDLGLRTVTHVLNASPGAGVGVTLSVGGTVISGTAIGRNEWLSAMADQLTAAGEIGVGLGGGLKDILEWDEDELKEGDDRFIHLKDAVYVFGHNGLLPTSGGMLWRGMLESVDGWSFGTFGES